MKEHTIVIYGFHPVSEVLRHRTRKVHALFYTAAQRLPQEIVKMLPSYITPVLQSKEYISRLAGVDEHQGIVVITDPFPIRKKQFNPIESPSLLLLDGIQDPRNMGALLRSAVCTGISGVIIPLKGSAPLNSAVWKSSAGLAERMIVAQPRSTSDALETIHSSGYHLYCATMEGLDIRMAEIKSPYCLIIGNEGKGVSEQIRSRTTRLAIPQTDPSISYNAAVAGGIVLFTLQTKIGAL